MLWEDLREEEFKEAVEKSKGVCIIPFGSLEMHGQHLPLGTDTIIAREVCRLAAEEEYAVVFPTIACGDMIGSRHAGEFSYSPELMMQILKETCNEVYRNGFDKIIIYIGHGGNGAVTSYFLRAYNHEKTPYTVFRVDINLDDCAPKALLEKGYDYLTEDDKKVLKDFVDEKKIYGHACFVENGLVYAVKPETVRLDKIRDLDGHSTHKYDEFYKNGIKAANAWSGDFPNMYEGDPHDGMNERIAKAMMEAAAEKLASQIKFIKEENITREARAEKMKKF